MWLGLSIEAVYTGVLGNFRLVGEDGLFSVDSVSAMNGLLPPSQPNVTGVTLITLTWNESQANGTVS